MPICLYCFTKITKENLLFRKNGENGTEVDRKLLEYWKLMNPETRPQTTPKIINPRRYPAALLKQRMDGSCVFAGKGFTEKNVICPSCHNQVPDVVLWQTQKHILVFTEDEQYGQKLQKRLFAGVHNQLGTDYEICVYGDDIGGPYEFDDEAFSDPVIKDRDLKKIHRIILQERSITVESIPRQYVISLLPIKMFYAETKEQQGLCSQILENAVANSVGIIMHLLPSVIAGIKADYAETEGQVDLPLEEMIMDFKEKYLPQNRNLEIPTAFLIQQRQVEANHFQASFEALGRVDEKGVHCFKDNAGMESFIKNHFDKYRFFPLYDSPADDSEIIDGVKWILKQI